VVRFLGGEAVRARVLASEPAADVALLQLDRLPKQAVVASVGDSDAVRVGDRVIVVGAPHGIGHTLTVGHISARRSSDAMLDAELFQTDAAINTGNSGGPMFNENGEVVGIVSYIISQSGGSEGLGFAVTSNAARRTVIDHGSMWGGMEVRMLNGELANAFNVPQKTGMLVQRVASGSAGAHLGIRAGSRRMKIGTDELIVGGDIVLSLMGISLAEPDADRKIRERINALGDREKMTVQVLRGGEVVDLNNYFFKDLLVPSAPAGSGKKKRR
jgi:S1-C subfamily serine protease